MMEWNIQSRAHACQTCARPFADKEPYHTLLLDDKRFFQRLDVCEACWKTQLSEGATDRKGFISHWQGIYAPPPAAPPDPIHKETAETLLRKLVERNDPAHAGACYILAVMLERKRILKVKAQEQRDGQRIFVYEHSKTADVLVVPDPNLKFDQLEKVQQDIDHLLAHGLETPSAPAASVDATAPSDNPPAAPAVAVEPAASQAAPILSEPATLAVAH